MSDTRRAIGYMRVSTPGQATNGLGLHRQRHKILETAEKLGLEVIAIYEDVGSGGGPFSDVRRGDLQDALRLAKVQDMPIIVSELSRLTREPSKVDGLILVDGVEIISGKFEEMLSPEMVREVIERAHRSRVNISKGTAAGHARRKAKGEVSGHAETLALGRENSIDTRTSRAGEVVDLVAATLEQHPEAMTKTAAEVARLLNDRGILSGWRRPWTPTSVRRVLRAAKAQIQERRGEQDEERVPAVVSVRSQQLTQEDQTLAELDALDLGPGWVPPAQSTASSGAELTREDESTDDDLALEQYEAWLDRQEALAKAEADAKSRKSSSTKTRSSKAPAATLTSTTTKDEIPVTQTPVESEPPAAASTPSSTSSTSEEMADSYQHHPGFGIF